jgi:hypothetical protein
MMTGDPKRDYPVFRKALLDEIAANIGPEAGERLANEEYQNVVFLVHIADDYGKLEVDVRLKNPAPLRKRRLTMSEDWYAHSADPKKLALDAIRLFRELLDANA